MPVSGPCSGETPLTFTVQGNEELVDYEATPRTQQYGAQQHFSAQGGKILANDNLPHKFSIQ